MPERLKIIITAEDGQVSKLLTPDSWTVGDLLRRLRQDRPLGRTQALVLLHVLEGGKVELPAVSTQLAQLTTLNGVIRMALKVENTFGGGPGRLYQLCSSDTCALL